MSRLRPEFVLIMCLVGTGACFTASAGSNTLLPPGIFAVDNNPAKPTFGDLGAQDGLTWAKAFDRIQDGIDAAFAAGGGEVWVANGNYGEARGEGYGNPSVSGSLVLKTNVQLYGGFQGYDADDFVGNEMARGHRSVTRGVSVIDGSTARGGSPAYHVVAVGGQSAATTGVILDGFHITGGLASSPDVSPTAYHLNRGGGIYIYGSNPTIRNCTILNNTAKVSGGGVALVYNPITNLPGNAIFENCVFHNNTAQRFVEYVGIAPQSNPVVGGGAVFVDARDGTTPSVPQFRYCTFNGNTALDNPEPEAFLGTGSNDIYTFVTGSGCSPIVTHSIFWPNTASALKSEGGGGSYDGGSSVTYSIVNPAYSCPAYANEPDPSPGVLALTCSTGNLTSNPNFTGASPEFPLAAGSPARNIGVLTTPNRDIQGVTRVSPDIGAFEGDGNLVGPTASIDAASLAPTTQYVPESYNLNNSGPGGTTGSLPVRIVWDINDDGVEDFNIINPVANYATAGTFTARLVLSNGIGSSTDSVTFTLANPMAVDAPTPANPTRNNYDALTLSVSVPPVPVRGFPPYTYQWQFSPDGVTYGTTLRDGSPLANGSYTSTRPGRDPDIPITTGVPSDPAFFASVPWSASGVTTPTLVFDHVVRGVHNGFYRCRVTDSQFNTLGIAEGRVDSAPAELTINQKVIILDAPTSLELYESNPSEIGVLVFGGNGGTTYTYSWDLFDPVSFQDRTILNSNVNPYTFIANAGPPTATTGGWVSGTGSPGFYSVLVNDTSLSGPNSADRVENLPVDIEPAVDVNITTPPAELIKNVTETLTLTTSLVGGYPGHTYVWTFNGVLLEDGQPHPSGSTASVSGATTGTLIVAGLTQQDGGDYDVQVVDSKGDTNNLADPCPQENGLCSDSDSALVQMTNNLVVLDQPVSRTVYAGDTASFEVTAGGGQLPYTFSWFWESTGGFGPFTMPFVGPHPASQTGSSVQITQVSPTVSRITVSNVGVEIVPTIRGDAGVYYSTVNDGVAINQPDTSDDAVLQVFRPLSITTQPQDQVAYDGGDATFSIQVSGGINNIRNFQWQVDTGSGFGDITGANSSTLTVTNLPLSSDGYQYRCVVTAPASDDVTSPLSNYEQTSAVATLEVSDQLIIVQGPEDVVTYTNEPPFTLKALFAGGSPFPSAPQYQTDWRRSGVSPAAPEVSVGAGTLILGSPNTTELTIDPAVVGAGVYNYRVTIADQIDSGSTGNARVEIADLPSFGQPLVDSLGREGDNFTWSVVVNGGVPPLEYVWERDVDGAKAFQPLPGNGPSITLTNIQFEDEGVYQVTVTDAGFAAPIQSQATLTIGDPLPLGGALGLAGLAALSALGGAVAIRRRKR